MGQDVTEYRGRKVAKRLVNLGIAGQIERPEALAGVEGRSRVQFTAWADVSSVKYEFDPDQPVVTERTIMAVESGSFEVLAIEAPAPAPDQPSLDEAVADGEPGEGKTAADVASLAEGIGEDPDAGKVTPITKPKRTRKPRGTTP